MGAWAILAFCIVAEVSATSLLTRSEGFARPMYGLFALKRFPVILQHIRHA